MQDNATTWALVPIKDFARAKSRLGTTLTAEQCAQLAACMAADVITALRGCTGIGHIACLGEEPEIRAFATQQGCKFITERPGEGLSANLDHAAQQLQDNGAQTLLIVPSDLPTITPADIDALLDNHHGGLTVCPAVRDGGTNALVISPPTALGFLFGEQSCARHCRAAEAAELEHHIVNAAPFGCDIDQPADLAWLCRAGAQGQTGRYLERSGISHSMDPAIDPAIDPEMDNTIDNKTHQPPSAATA